MIIDFLTLPSCGVVFYSVAWELRSSSLHQLVLNKLLHMNDYQPAVIINSDTQTCLMSEPHYFIVLQSATNAQFINTWTKRLI